MIRLPRPDRPDARAMTLPTRYLEDKYEILDKLREGGMGAIYKVRHLLLDDVRVVKVLRPHVADDPSIRQRFESEAKLAIRVRHPNVAQLFDYSVDDRGTALIVMEYIDGVTLQDLIARAPVRSLALTVEIARQGLLALACLHRHGIVHRDISSDNLMLTQGFDGGPQVKLIDLGIAKDPLSEATATETGVFLGKARYSAPEQFQEGGASALRPVADVYSFGVLFYELLTGQLPVEGTSFASMASGHLLRPPVPFEKSDPLARVPDDLRGIVLRALEKQPDDRIRSADEFIDLIRPFAGDEKAVASEFRELMGTVKSGPAAEARPPVRVEDETGTLPEKPEPAAERRRPPAAPAARPRSRAALAMALVGVVVLAAASFVAWTILAQGDGAGKRLRETDRGARGLADLPERDLAAIEAKQDRLAGLIGDLEAAGPVAGEDAEALATDLRERLDREERRLGSLYGIRERLDMYATDPETDTAALRRKELEYDLLGVQSITVFLREFPNDPTGLGFQQEAFREHERIRRLIAQRVEEEDR
jgi:serine/threonine-protein kinase